MFFFVLQKLNCHGGTWYSTANFTDWFHFLHVSFNVYNKKPNMVAKPFFEKRTKTEWTCRVWNIITYSFRRYSWFGHNVRLLISIYSTFVIYMNIKYYQTLEKKRSLDTCTSYTISGSAPSLFYSWFGHNVRLLIFVYSTSVIDMNIKYYQALENKTLSWYLYIVHNIREAAPSFFLSYQDSLAAIFNFCITEVRNK